MKNLLHTLLTFSLILSFVSCGQTKYSIGTDYDKDFKVSSKVQPPVIHQNGAEAFSSTESQSDAEIPETAVTDELNSVVTEESPEPLQISELIPRMKEEIDNLLATTNSKIVTRQLQKTKEAINSVNFNSEESLKNILTGKQEKMSAFQKLKSKITAKMLEKVVNKAGAASAMDTADILAICALVSGLLAWVAYYGSFLFGIAAIVLGIIALKQGTSRRGMALAGIILGAIAMLFWLMLIFVFIAVF